MNVAITKERPDEKLVEGALNNSPEEKHDYKKMREPVLLYHLLQSDGSSLRQCSPDTGLDT